jgi:hypothetical protein
MIYSHAKSNVASNSGQSGKKADAVFSDGNKV